MRTKVNRSVDVMDDRVVMATFAGSVVGVFLVPFWALFPWLVVVPVGSLISSVWIISGPSKRGLLRKLGVAAIGLNVASIVAGS